MTEPGLAVPAATPAATGVRAQRPATRWMQRLAEEELTAADSTGLAVDTPPTSTADDTAADPTDTPSDEDLTVEPSHDADVVASLGAAVLFVLALLWLAAMMWSARASFSGNANDPAVLISSAALVLPGIMAATLLAGAASGLAAASRFAHPAGCGVRAVLRRLFIAVIAAALVGAVAAGVILFTFGVNSAIGVIAATVGIAAFLAGATAALPAAPLAAGVAATLSVFVSGALVNLFQNPLKSLLGAGATVASQAEAADRLLLVSALISGLVAGTMAYLFLRKREPGRAWPWYLLAGAVPGLLSLFGEIVTRVGGASLFSLVGGFSDDDKAVVDYLTGAHITSGLVIAFAGGISAMILIGRTLRRPDEPVDEPVDGFPEASASGPSGTSPTSSAPGSATASEAGSSRRPRATSTTSSPSATSAAAATSAPSAMSTAAASSASATSSVSSVSSAASASAASAAASASDDAVGADGWPVVEA